MTSQIITANRLKDGRVVFLTGDGDWSESITASCVIEKKGDLDALTKQGQDAATAPVVVDPYSIEVETADGRIRPLRYRERIRAFGPSIHPDFAKQPVPEHFEQRDGVSSVRINGA